MQNVQDIFNRLEKIKKEQKELKASYRDALKNSFEYQQVSEKARELRDKKKQIESSIKADSVAELEKLEALQADFQSEMELLSDVALSQYVKGENVEVRDSAENRYQPSFTVRFKKVY